MAKRRKIRIHGSHKVPINEQALTKLIRHYYKGKKNVILRFTPQVGNAWGDHLYVSQSKTHHIRINPSWCSFNKTTETRDFTDLSTTGKLEKMNDYDTCCRIIHTLLHEIKHAEQCDRNPIRYQKCSDDLHPHMKNNKLKYELSSLETEAEGWALLNFNKALERYESWSNG